MIAAFGNLDVRRVAWSRQHPRRRFVIKIVRHVGDGAVLSLLGESALSSARIYFRAGNQNVDERPRSSRRSREARGGKYNLQFTGSDHSVHFRNILATITTKPL